MADLGSLPGRRDTTRQITNNRSSILPSRRDTDTAPLVVRSDLRTAARGDGGADELRRVLSQFTDSAQAFGNARIAGSQDRLREEAAQGALDAAAGGEAKATTDAYTEAFYNVRAESLFNTFSTETQQAVEEAINNGAEPAEIQALVMARIGEFRDEVVDTIPVSTAQRNVASRISQMGRELETTVNTRIRERTQQEFITTAQGNIRTALEADQPLDFEGYVATFRAGNLAPAEAKADAMAAVLAVALDRDNPRPELLDQLLDSKQADGKTPSLNATEQMQVLDRISQARSLQEQKEKEEREERRDALLEGWFTKAVGGNIVDDEIIQAGRDGVLEPQEVMQYLGLTENLRDAVADGHANDDFVLEIAQRAAMGNPPSNAQILAWQREGRFGSGREGLRAAIRFLQDNTAARNAARTNAATLAAWGMSERNERTRAVSTARTFLWEQTKPELPEGTRMSTYQGQMMVMQDREYHRRVRGGEDPFAVANDLIRRNQAVIARDRRPGPAPLPANGAPPPGNYTWRPSS